MKTEKRLTMALSVLVALMMLAVPLASSSNLFVDGGQTNSNGDAPLLGDEEAEPGVEILNVWVIDSQASYNKLLQYGFDENSFKGNGADFAKNPWIAVVYKISGGVTATNLTISNSNMENELIKTVTYNDDKVHAFTAYLGDAPTFDANGDNLGINVTDDYYGQSFNVSVNATKDGKTYSDSTSLTYAEPSEFSVKDVWIIDSQDSLDKIAKYVGKDVQKTNFGETWGSNDRPWIAIAYYAPANAGTVDFTLSSDITNMTTPKTITAKVGEKEGIHVFTAYIGSSAVADSKEDAFKLGTINSFEAAKGTYELKVDGTTDVYKVTYSGKPSDVYTYTFNLNIPDSEGRISLDNINVVTTDKAGQIVFSQDPNDKNIVYATVSSDVKIGEIIKAITVTKDGYLFNSWTDENGVQYTSDMQDAVKKSMVLNANWEIQDDWVQVPVDVAYDGNTYKYSTAMPADKGGKTVTINSSSIIKLLPKEIKISGYVINQPNVTITDVYTYTVNENNADGKDIKADNSTISITSSVFIEYSLTSYTKITVLCDVFNDEKAVMYAYNSNNYTYQQVWNALTGANNNGVTAADLGLKKAFGANAESQKAALNVVKNGNITTTADGKYRVLNWDSGVALDDTKTAPGVDLTLNVELNGYNVIFMVNGQAQIVNIPYNQLTVDKCPFDVTGVNHWVYITYENYAKGLINSNTLMPFNFNSQSNIKTVNDVMAVDETPTFVFIACFERADNTAYAVFDASKDANIAGNYGNKYIKSIVIPGKAASGNNSTVIPLPAVQPVYESKNVLIGYVDSKGNTYSNTGEAPSKYGEKNSISFFNANVVSYKYTITFYNGSDVNGIFYYGGDSQTSNNSIKTGLVAFSYNGVAYEYKATLVGDASKAFNNILYPAKDGYQITQWKDSDGNVMLDKVTPTYTDGKLTGGEYVVEFKKISSDMSFYANFEAKEYTIVYSGNTATQTNEMSQSVKVDQNVNLFSDSTFSNDGFKLKEWNTRPDGKGTSYALGASFALNGEQFEDLKDGKFTLYAIWEKVGASDNPGDNTDGGNDNTALYLIAGMLAVIAILAIVGIVLMRRK